MTTATATYAPAETSAAFQSRIQTIAAQVGIGDPPTLLSEGEASPETVWAVNAIISQLGQASAGTASVQHTIQQAAGGALSQRATAGTGDPAYQAANALNGWLGHLQSVFGTLAEAGQDLETTALSLDQQAATLQSSTGQAASEAETATHTAESVSEQVQSAAAAVEQMGASIQEIAKSANEAASVAINAVDKAEQTSATVTSLNTSSQQIGQVVKVITSIAEQTNLLALNAT